MSGPLEGVRILEMTMAQHGPVACAMLADMGAEVIKIEDTMGGDKGRYFTTIMGLEVGHNFYFESNNRNKRSLRVDLKRTEGREIIHRLLKTHDVFVTNMRAKAIKSLGMDYETLSAICPQLIHATGYGFGKYGPDAEKPALDIAAQARGGIWSISGDPDQPPSAIGGGMADQVGAAMLAYGITLALYERERTGKGQELNTSLLGTQAFVGALQLQSYLSNKQLVEVPSRSNAQNPMWNTYRCQDGNWLVLAMLSSDKYWPEFCGAIGMKELESDDRFKDQEARGKHHTELIRILDECFGSRTCAEWIERFENTDLIWSKVNDYEDVSKDPQILANNYIVDYDHPEYGPQQMVGLPVQFSRTPGAIRRHAPDYGEHSTEILEELGYSWDEIGELAGNEVI